MECDRTLPDEPGDHSPSYAKGCVGVDPPMLCIVSVESICFGYQDQIVVGNFADHGAGVEDVRTKSNSVLYIIRVDCEEAIQHFCSGLKAVEIVES